MIDKQRCYSLDKSITRKQLSNIYSEEYCKQFSTSQISQLYSYLERNNIFSIKKECTKENTIFSNIPQSPNLFYYIGNIDLITYPTLGIVGPRDPSNYATEIIHKLCKELKLYNIVTISGGADGIDSICHNESLENNIPTICILGGGIDYYLRNNHLIKKIIGMGGLILSEFKLFSKPERYTFPMRNRIIAGLSDYLFIPEAGEKSGSLLTAKYMDGLHKPIYGVIGNILKEKNRGLHDFIQQRKVTPIFSIESFCKDIFKKKESIDKIIRHKDIEKTMNIGKYGKKILSYNNQGSISFEKVYYELGVNSNELLSEISLLELDGYIQFKDNIIHFI